MSKTLEEIREAKKELEKDIRDLLESFMEENGLAIKEIAVNYYKLTDQGTGQIVGSGITGLEVKLDVEI